LAQYLYGYEIDLDGIAYDRPPHTEDEVHPTIDNVVIGAWACRNQAKKGSRCRLAGPLLFPPAEEMRDRDRRDDNAGDSASLTR